MTYFTFSLLHLYPQPAANISSAFHVASQYPYSPLWLHLLWLISEECIVFQLLTESIRSVCALDHSLGMLSYIPLLFNFSVSTVSSFQIIKMQSTPY